MSASAQNLSREQVSTPDGWKLNIGAYGKNYIDTGNSVGRISGSLEGLDFRDNPEPPYMGGYVAVVMPKNGWSEKNYNFTSDIRSIAESDGVWDIQLRIKGEKGPVTLNFDIEGEFPVEHEVVLLDLINAETYNIKETTLVTLNQNWDELPIFPLKIIAGTSAYVKSMTQEIFSVIPELFNLHQNYPNPFNPITTIRFEVSTPSKISLKIYNLIGQEVISLTESWFPIGTHELVWNGEDHRGSQVGSGVYIYQMNTDSFQKTRKMIFIK